MEYFRYFATVLRMKITHKIHTRSGAFAVISLTTWFMSLLEECRRVWSHRLENSKNDL